jgi:anti-anti-sigma regulatory factor
MSEPRTPSTPKNTSSPQEANPEELLQQVLMKEHYYLRMFHSMPIALGLIEVINYTTFRVLVANRAAVLASGYDSVDGMVVSEMFPPEELVYFETLFHELLDQQTSVLHREIMFVRDSGAVFWLSCSFIAVCNARGHITHLLFVATETTRERRAELAEQEVYERQIEEQAAKLAEPEPPCLRVNDTTLLFPLIGLVDLDRLERLMEIFRRAVQETQARIIIVDITGMPSVDGSVAQSFLEAAKAMRSLGTQVVVSGVRAEIDREMEAWSLDMGKIRYFETLQQALEALETLEEND